MRQKAFPAGKASQSFWGRGPRKPIKSVISGTRAAEMTLLAQDGPTFPSGIEAHLVRISLKKVAEATFLKHSNRQGRIAALPIVCALPRVRQILL